MDVFLSYSSKDRPLVKDIYKYLEDNDLNCFVDHRNIDKGKDYRECITEAIERCKLFVVIFTEEYNISMATDTEIGIADEEHKDLIIFRIAPETISYKGIKKWALNGKQWINAIGRPYDKFKDLSICIKQHLNIKENTGDKNKDFDSSKIIEIKNNKLNFVKVSGGTFMMGADFKNSEYAQKDEYPLHEVTLKNFYILDTVITQSLWNSIMHSNPSNNIGVDLPVENVTWEQCNDFANKLYKETGLKFRLPTEAEWEYAARGGSKTKGSLLSGSSNYESVAWTIRNSNDRTHKVKTLAPNELGIYDMSGNVNEWCMDWYDKKYEKKPVTNPKGPRTGVCKVTRGGSWMTEPMCCRNSYRDYCSPMNHYPDLGFRLVLDE